MELNTTVMTNLAKFAEEREQKKPAAAPPKAVATSSDGGLKSEALFGMMDAHLAAGNGEPIIKKVGATFAWEITLKKGGKPVAVWDCDLKNMPGHVKKGKPSKVDATFTMTDDDFVGICTGKLNPQTAFMTGKMKIKGNLAKATKFTPDLFPPSTPEAIANFKATGKL